MARWSALESFAERHGNRPLARILGVSESTVRSARTGRAGRPGVQASSRATLEQKSKGYGPVRLERAYEADRASRGEKQYKSSTPRRGASKNAPYSVKLPRGMTGQATQIGKPGGHELFRSQVEQLVADMDAQIGRDKHWHVAIHGVWLDETGRYTEGGEAGVTKPRWISTVKLGQEVLDALAATQAAIADEKRIIDAFRFIDPAEKTRTERSITASFAREFAHQLTGLNWQRVDAIYIRHAKEF